MDLEQPKLSFGSHVRELAVQYLYEIEIRRQSIDRRDAVSFFLSYHEVYSEKEQNFFRSIISGVANHRTEIDVQIIEAAKNWKFSRITVTDRSVLRVAVWELCYRKDPVSTAVILSEAVRIAQRLGTEFSGKFVNGVLQTIADLQRKPKSPGVVPASERVGNQPSL